MATFQGTVTQLLDHLGYTTSLSQGRRVVVQGGVKINGIVVQDLVNVFEFKLNDVIQIGNNPPFRFGSQ
jgi:ribosomal protein S4E